MSVAFMMDGGTTLTDLVSRGALTMTGGVANTWTGDESNFRALLGRRAPVIAQATDNLYALADTQSFEGGTAGAWGSPDLCTIAASTDTAWHGLYSGKQVCTGAGNTYVYNSIKAVTAAGSQYTASARFKGTAGKSIRLAFYGDTSGFTVTDVVATGAWQAISVTKTFAAGDTTNREVYLRQLGAAVNDICYWDALQLEAGAVATPFALNSRTACTCTYPTAGVLTAGQSTTVVAVVNTPWDGTSTIAHALLDTRNVGWFQGLEIHCEFAGGGLLYGRASGDATYKQQRIGINAANWAANTNHVIILVHNAVADSVALYLDGVLAVTPGSTGTSIPTAQGATINVGTYANAAGGHLNGAILLALIKGVASAGEIARINRLFSVQNTWQSNNIANTARIGGACAGCGASLNDYIGLDDPRLW